MIDEINSKSYWDGRFEGSWQAAEGPAQTAFFYQIALNIFPQWFISALRSENLSLCDWGCATGEGSNMLQQTLEVPVAGVDFSKVAIEVAQKKFPEMEFRSDNYLDNSQYQVSYDIIFSSNTLEHFSDPWETARLVSEYAQHAIVFLLPYKEGELIDEHFVEFNENSIPVDIAGKFKLSYSKVVDVSQLPDTRWPGKQILLVYSTPQFAAKNQRNLDDCNIEKDISPSEFREIISVKDAQVNNEIEAREDQNAEWLEKVELLEKQLVEKDASLAEEMETRASLSRQHTDALKEQSEIQLKLKQQLSQKEIEKMSLEMRMASIDNQRNDWESRARAIESSEFWKLTWPLRISLQGVRGLTDKSGRNIYRLSRIREMISTRGFSETGKWLMQKVANVNRSTAIRVNEAPTRIKYQQRKRMPQLSEGSEFNSLNVGFYISSLHAVGGLELWSLDIAEYLSKAGHKLILIVQDREPATEISAKFILEFPGQIIFLNQKASILGEQAQRSNLDVVIVSHVYEGIASINEDILIIEVIHNIYYWQYRNRMVMAARHRINCYIAVSDCTKKYASEYLHLDPQTIHVIPHVLRKTGLYRPYRSFLEKRYKSEQFRVLCVANFYPQKNLICLIEAFSRLEKEDAVLILAGGHFISNYTSRINDVISQHGLEDRIRLTGSLSRNELSREYSLANMFVFPSLYEGYGLATMEATYFGLPIVFSNTGYANNFLTEQASNGIMVDIAQPFENLIDKKIHSASYNPPERSIKALADAMQHIIDNYTQYLDAALENADTIPSLDSSEITRAYTDVIQSAMRIKSSEKQQITETN